MNRIEVLVVRTPILNSRLGMIGLREEGFGVGQEKGLLRLVVPE